ncbi:MAG: sulfurtransferase [Chloroflexi bacterium]|nr:sulfurtransferase [Chloroflexota bacterium]
MAHPESLVETDWVAEHLNDDSIRLVEVDVDLSSYAEAHIPGAIQWDWMSHLNTTVQRDILSREEMSKLLGDCGIGRDTRVVLYGDNNNWFAAYAFWQMKLYGHDKVAMMNGGRQKWIGEGRETTTEVPTFASQSYSTSGVNEGLRALRDHVLQAVRGESSVELVDVRSPAEYNGEVIAPAHLPQEGAQRAGHIPGASSIPWGQAVNESDGTFKSVGELKDLYGGKGITGTREVITYCRIGERSSHTWFALTQLLGYENIRNNDGSWTEYGSMIGVPIEL